MFFTIFSELTICPCLDDYSAYKSPLFLVKNSIPAITSKTDSSKSVGYAIDNDTYISV